LINSQTELGDFPQQVIDLFLCTQREEIMRKERERERDRRRREAACRLRKSLKSSLIKEDL
jgi:hypothetical protein